MNFRKIFVAAAWYRRGCRPKGLLHNLRLVPSVVCCLGLMLWEARSQDRVPTISFQGALAEVGGQPLPNANYDLIFRFYSNAVGGVNLGTAKVTGVMVSGGLASAAIPVHAGWFDGGVRYLGITVAGRNSDEELVPRVLVTAVPYSIRAYSVGDEEGNYSAKSAMLNKCEIVGGSARVTIGPNHGDSDASIRLSHMLDPEAGWWVIDPGVAAPGNLGFLRREPGHRPFEYVEEESFIMTREGKFGVGTLYPLAKLDIRGSGRIGAVNITGESGANVAGALLDVQGLARMTVCQITSARDAKQEFAPVDTTAVLAKLSALPIATWAYKTSSEVRHLGPLAEDFYAAFALGDSTRHIATVDADGVALAAIQGLNKKLEDQVRDKDGRIAALEQRIVQLEKLIQPHRREP